MATVPKPETTTTKRESKTNTKQKKKPQRGMGVDKLERLRIEERWRKITESLNHPDHQHHFQNVHTTTLSSVSNPTFSVPLHYGGGGPIVVNSSGSGLFGVDRAGFVVQRISGNAFSCGSSGVKVVGGMVMEPVMGDPNPYSIGALDQRGSVYEISKELSSMPKMQSVPSDRCDTCCKKKRFNGEKMGAHGGKDKCSEMLPASSGTSCFGLKAEAIPTFAGNHTLGLGFGARASRNGYAENQGVEVVAIHRKGNLSARGGESVVMEYDFFPADNKQDLHRSGSYFKDFEILPMEASAAVLGGGGSGTSSGDQASNLVDLSLKLSY